MGGQWVLECGGCIPFVILFLREEAAIIAGFKPFFGISPGTW